MATYQVLYWKNIPSQVKVHGDRPLSRQLSARFQILIDQVAMAEGLTGSDDYLNQFSWGDKTDLDGSPEEAIESIVNRLEAQFDQIAAASRCK